MRLMSVDPTMTALETARLSPTSPTAHAAAEFGRRLARTHAFCPEGTRVFGQAPAGLRDTSAGLNQEPTGLNQEPTRLSEDLTQQDRTTNTRHIIAAMGDAPLPLVPMDQLPGTGASSMPRTASCPICPTRFATDPSAPRDTESLSNCVRSSATVPSIHHNPSLSPPMPPSSTEISGQATSSGPATPQTCMNASLWATMKPHTQALPSRRTASRKSYSKPKIFLVRPTIDR